MRFLGRNALHMAGQDLRDHFNAHGAELRLMMRPGLDPFSAVMEAAQSEAREMNAN